MVEDPFTGAEVRRRDLLAERADGRLGGRAYRTAIRHMKLRDGEGREWVLGPEDGLWYRRDRGRWIEADPPRRLICPTCGTHNLVRHSFCVQCGGRLRRPPGL